MYAAVSTLFVPAPRLDEALATLDRLTPSLRRHAAVQGVTVLADRASGKITVVLVCASPEIAARLPPIHLAGLAVGEARVEQVLAPLHEHYTESPEASFP